MNEKQPHLLTILDILSAVLLVIATLMVFFYAPVESQMGYVQKVFYFHTASAWVGMLAFLTSAVTSGIFLRSHQMKWDNASLSAIEIGMVFMLVAIVSGSIWAKPIWNTWWT